MKRCFNIVITVIKGQTKSKLLFQADISSKKQTNESNLLRFLEKIEDTKKTFRNCLTFDKHFKVNLKKLFLSHFIEEKYIL